MNREGLKTQTKRFIKAHKDGRLICVVHRETAVRMNFRLHEIKKGYAYDFGHLLEELGFRPTIDDYYTISVGGMSKPFALNLKILKGLLSEKLIKQVTYDELLQKDMIVL